MITAEEYKKALEERRIVITGKRYTSNGWTEFNVYEIKDNRLLPVLVEKSPYWNNGKRPEGNYRCTAWGTSRTLEVILSIGYTLGLKFEEIRQNYIELP